MQYFRKAFLSVRRLFDREKKEHIPFSDLFMRFQGILQKNNAAMKLIADMGGKAGGDFVFDRKYLEDSVNDLKGYILSSAYDLNFITGNKYLEIYEVIENFAKELYRVLAGKAAALDGKRIYYLEELEEGTEDVVGYKAYRLSRIAHLPHINIPPGFVVAIGAFRDYLAYNNLYEKITNIIEACAREEKSVESVSNAARLMILGGEIPPDLRREILNAASQISNGNVESTFFCVRSSALGEDGDLSFAGLHDSFLNIQHGELLSMFKRVLASLFNQASLEYRLRMNLFSMELAMAVLYQTMVRSRVAGVLYTLDPNEPERRESIVSGSWGLGQVIVEGQGAADTFRISRNSPYRIIEQTIQRKPLMMAPYEKGPLSSVPEELQKEPCLTQKEAEAIVETGLTLERYFKRPLDVEWSMDEEGRLWILQARPMKIRRTKPSSYPQRRKALQGHKILLKGRGVIAYRGIGAGPVWIFEDGRDLSGFPAGAVLVSHYATPLLAKVIPRASAVITDIGSITGHMATVAREFRVPTIVGTDIATKTLTSEQIITVDAERNIIYEDRIEELIHHQLLDEPAFEITSEFRLLRRLLKKIAPLTLTNPEDANFTIKGCRTFHDIMRFIHEKAFQALVQVGKDPRTLLRQGGRRLRSSIPLDLILIDIGGGISEVSDKNIYVDPDQIRSLPMKAIWEGLSCPQTWSMDPISVDLKGLISSLSRTQGVEYLGNTLPAVNLGVISANYVNLSLPLGYHFTAIEASIGEAPENNYVSFRFAGGVTDITRRSRRAALLAAILEKFGFKLDINGDLVIARATQMTKDQIEKNLHLIGKLIGFTRQLDVLLKTDEDVDRYFKAFIAQAETSNQPNIKQKEG
ncbi:MAG: hypothetical protein JRH18_19445 [Deltaproteobacteria bacterium]|nr:hypothetical protein [Deltaproteobacteria bacterium]MBW2153828.1 hypothetical protein [Deltaproteobacteria bacterium]